MTMIPAGYDPSYCRPCSTLAHPERVLISSGMCSSSCRHHREIAIQARRASTLWLAGSTTSIYIVIYDQLPRKQIFVGFFWSTYVHTSWQGIAAAITLCFDFSRSLESLIGSCYRQMRLTEYSLYINLSEDLGAHPWPNCLSNCTQYIQETS